MSSLLAAAAIATTFNSYPVFENPSARVEAIIDKGVIAELVVRCDKGTAIIAASLLEHTYCGPDFKCYASLDTAILKSCK